MKAIQFERCLDCKWHRVVDAGLYCSLLGKSKKVPGGIFPSCPLPDWPEATPASLEKLAEELHKYFFGELPDDSGKEAIIGMLETKLGSIGVIVREEEKDGK